MPFVPNAKGTLLIPSGPPHDPDRLHLHVILTEACPEGMHLVGSISSIRDGQFHDPTCVIEAEEHRFINRPSYVLYRRTTTIRGGHMAICVDGWLFKPDDPVSDDLYQRICAGIADSRFTPRGMIRYWRENDPT